MNNECLIYLWFTETTYVTIDSDLVVFIFQMELYANDFLPVLNSLRNRTDAGRLVNFYKC